MWPFSSYTQDATRHTQASTTPQTQGKNATGQQPQHPITAHLQPGTPEARRAAAGLRCRAQSMLMRAKEIETERRRATSAKPGILATSASRIQRPGYSIIVSLVSETVSEGTKSRSSTFTSHPRTDSLSSHATIATLQSPLPSHLHSTKPCTPSPSPSPSFVPPGATLPELQISLSNLVDLIHDFTYAFFTRLSEPSMSRRDPHWISAHHAWTDGYETESLVLQYHGLGAHCGRLWSSNALRRDCVVTVIWLILRDFVLETESGQGMPEEKASSSSSSSSSKCTSSSILPFPPSFSTAFCKLLDEEDEETIARMTPHACSAYEVQHLTQNGTVLPEACVDLVQAVVEVLVAHLRPFLNLMHEDPYRHLERLLPMVTMIVAAAFLLKAKMMMHPEVVYRILMEFDEKRILGVRRAMDEDQGTVESDY